MMNPVVWPDQCHCQHNTLTYVLMMKIFSLKCVSFRLVHSQVLFYTHVRMESYKLRHE